MKKVTKIEHDVRIRTAENGYVVEVGCKQFVFENMETLLAKLEENER